MALPTWNGAAAVYAKAYRRLEHLAAAGHVQPIKRGVRTVGCAPSEEMRELVDAMNQGDEEQLKFLQLTYDQRFGYIASE
jgi:hypothetical protein